MLIFTNHLIFEQTVFLSAHPCDKCIHLLFFSRKNRHFFKSTTICKILLAWFRNQSHALESTHTACYSKQISLSQHLESVLNSMILWELLLSKKCEREGREMEYREWSIIDSPMAIRALFNLNEPHPNTKTHPFCVLKEIFSSPPFI